MFYLDFYFVSLVFFSSECRLQAIFLGLLLRLSPFTSCARRQVHWKARLPHLGSDHRVLSSNWVGEGRAAREYLFYALFSARGNPKRPNNPKKVSYIIYLNFFLIVSLLPLLSCSFGMLKTVYFQFFVVYLMFFVLCDFFLSVF